MQDNRFVKHMNWDHNNLNKGDKCESKHDKCDCMRKHHKEDKCDCMRKHHEEDKCDDKFSHNCKGCICNLLKRFEPGTLVDVLLSGGGSFLGVIFVSLDPKNCCAYFLEVGAAAAATPIVIDCQKIDGIRRNPAA
ncbi:hypothetical protein ACQKII_17370 [Lysinibacillus sp. NPDC048646]|uniref:hypothetical protein n=1 Tax=Lysinibacillus sp. NPDC048646 TaxID=3390574 RepID=UPI003D081C9E